jgi:hypothetical protein
VPFALDKEVLSAICSIFSSKETDNASGERSVLSFQLRAQGFKALQILLQHPPNLKLFLDQKNLGTSLFELAIGQTSAELRNADGPISEIERRLAALEMSLASSLPASQSTALTSATTAFAMVSLADLSASSAATPGALADSGIAGPGIGVAQKRVSMSNLFSGDPFRFDKKSNKLSKDEKKEKKAGGPEEKKKEEKKKEEKKREWKITWNPSRYDAFLFLISFSYLLATSSYADIEGGKSSKNSVDGSVSSSGGGNILPLF